MVSPGTRKSGALFALLPVLDALAAELEEFVVCEGALAEAETEAEVEKEELLMVVPLMSGG